MLNNERTGETEGDDRIQRLLDLEVPTALPPEERLLLALLRQSVLDYFGEDPVQRLSAALYFAHDSIYRTTLQLFNLPEDLLPCGVDLSDFRKEERMDENFERDGLGLDMLVGQLSGTQLKILMTMGMLDLPVATRSISLRCGLSRSTVLTAMDHMARQGLVMRDDSKGRAYWSLPDAVSKVMAKAWGGQES